jgi:hypothetical protein
MQAKQAKQEKAIIMHDSPEAAQAVFINLPDGSTYGRGWVSVNRHFYATEAEARNNSATHYKCEGCGSICEYRSYCETCHSKWQREKYLKMPFKKYDGVSYLTLWDDDKFFYSEEEVREWCADNETLPENLPLVICEPNHLCMVDSSYWDYIMPEDGDGGLPKDVQDALNLLNATIEKSAPISWGMGEYRTTIENVIHVTDVEFETGNG